MSIVLDAFKKKITWGTAAEKIGGWFSALVKGDPALQQAAGDAMALLKQATSNALADAETALSPHIIPAVEAAEGALDKALAGATGGVAAAFTPMLDATITKLAESVKAGADAWALEQRAKAAGVGKPAAPPQ